MIPSCFRAPATSAGPSLTTSVYETHLGTASLTWSSTTLGLSLLADLRPSNFPADELDHLHFRIRPWILWKRRGSKRFHIRAHFREVEFTWDLTSATFPASGGPEPASGFFVAVSINNEMLLIAGDMENEAFKKTRTRRAKKSTIPAMISRRERVELGEKGGKRSYSTAVRFGGRERKILIDLEEKGKEVGLSLGVDEERVLEVTRLRWMFRGSEWLELEGGDRIQVSWDLHKWIFRSKGEEFGHAVFVFGFEREEEEGHFGNGGGCEAVEGYFGKNCNWSEISSGSSFSSLRSSSVSGSTVEEWASPEEAELRSSDGFSLVVYAWRK